MAKLHLVSDDEHGKFYVFHCPGCERGHMLPVSGSKAWEWNGRIDKPTFTPSILVNKGRANPMVPVCHSHVTEGVIDFLPDSTHKLSGKKVDIPEWE